MAECFTGMPSSRILLATSQVLAHGNLTCCNHGFTGEGGGAWRREVRHQNHKAKRQLSQGSNLEQQVLAQCHCFKSLCWHSFSGEDVLIKAQCNGLGNTTEGSGLLNNMVHGLWKNQKKKKTWHVMGTPAPKPCNLFNLWRCLVWSLSVGGYQSSLGVIRIENGV